MSLSVTKNPHKISLSERAVAEGFDSIHQYLLDVMADYSVVEALCDEGCQVEPDGRCSHGCPSPLLAAGLI